MSKIIFITGGARSGKSKFAEQVSSGFGTSLCYLATSQILDDEMEDRISKHRQRRGDSWKTIEEPLHLTQALACCDCSYQAVLVDCVTLWLSNILLRYVDLGENAEERILEDVHRLVVTLRGMAIPVILVSNEVGQGIVPENRLARQFRDIAGQANQLLAAAADEVHVVISGIPLKLK